ncbi:transcriptional regulator [Bifidobacterium pullorum subsp. saeculare]|uniref:Transcriptional regulator n=1 Tax=Bifidobacterium pullorum subsp. saeculare TaxID=78257 RepID=A0A939B943_9BIFI|nr:transcriptional regulator [Bifidobacterium pullorum]MBM6699079.1 transcriptional regulator [Bifidobacterium pullorum subsp. saeculare]
MSLADDLKQWDKVIQSPLRFTIMAMLDGVDALGFSDIRAASETSAPTLSKQLTVLENAGYVQVSKVTRGRRVLTEMSATPEGRQAYRRQLELLRRIASR